MIFETLFFLFNLIPQISVIHFSYAKLYGKGSQTRVARMEVSYLFSRRHRLGISKIQIIIVPI